MRTLTVLVAASLLFSQISEAQYEKGDGSELIVKYLDILVSEKEPLLADYINFYGLGSEQEKRLELIECSRKGWDFSSANCRSFIERRWENPNKNISWYLGWIRSRFSTPGKEYVILGSELYSEGFLHSLTEVCIGGKVFKIFENLSPNMETGLKVGVLSVEERHIESYLHESKPSLRD